MLQEQSQPKAQPGGALNDPTVELRNADRNVVCSNDMRAKRQTAPTSSRGDSRRKTPRVGLVADTSAWVDGMGSRLNN